jgi:hypothetical protein
VSRSVCRIIPSARSVRFNASNCFSDPQRYTPGRLQQSLDAAGFQVEQLFDFNRVSVPGWWLNGKVLRRRTFSRVQLKVFDVLMPLLKKVDRVWPWTGLSVIAIATKREGAAASRTAVHLTGQVSCDDGAFATMRGTQ